MTFGALLLCTLLPLLGGAPPSAMRQETHRVACLHRGSNVIPDSVDGSYPLQLGRLLGAGYEVRTFLLGERALEVWGPECVMIEPGDVDSTSQAGNPGSLTTDDLANIVTSIGGFQSKPRIILLLPPPSFPSSREADSLLLCGSIQRIRSVAYSSGCEVVDLHSMFLANQGSGYGLPCSSPRAPELIAGRLKDIITISEVPCVDISRVSSGPSTRSSYYGFECYSFSFGGREARIVRPKRAAKGSPWIWRARFWGHEPQTEIALLERGFHVVYCDVAELFGNDEALGIWDSFYRSLTGAGLSRKTVLEGLSRGGMYIYRWAVRNPSLIACVYADAPVLDMKSWPGGKGKGGGNPVEWKRFKDDFGITSEEDALAFKGNPLDMASEIARGGFPMLHVCGLADPVVPIEENTDPFEKKILASGGRITVIRKPGIGHHPHSLPDPDPIVRFILGASPGAQ